MHISRFDTAQSKTRFARVTGKLRAAFGRIALCACLSCIATPGWSYEVSAPPRSEVARLSLDPFYKKYTQINGFPIVASEKTSDFALREASYLIENMLSARPDILSALREAKVRFAIMAVDEFTTQLPEHSHLEPKAYWDKRARGLGPTPDAPAVSSGEENLLGYSGDPYPSENLLIHEFAHAIHLMGINTIDPGFQKRLEESYRSAMQNGLWQGTYASTNAAEYWAEGVQTWFGTNRENDDLHNHVNTRQELIDYDPFLAGLIEQELGRSQWRYVKPSDRTPGSAHLEGYQPELAPKFEWPAKMVADFEKVENGLGVPRLPLLRSSDAQSAKSASSAGRSVMITVSNQSDKRLALNWIDQEGERRPYLSVGPGQKIRQQTYSGHVWALLDETGDPVAHFEAGDEDAWVEIE